MNVRGFGLVPVVLVALLAHTATCAAQSTSTPTAWVAGAVNAKQPAAQLVFTAPNQPPMDFGNASRTSVSCTNTRIADESCSDASRDNLVFGAPSAPVVGPLVPISLVPGPPNLSANGTLSVVVTGAGVAPASLALSCTVATNGANAFSIVSGATQTLTAPAALGAAMPIGVTCTRAVQDTAATVTCTQTATPGPNPPNLTATVSCPGTGGAPNGSSSPAAPGPIAILGTPSAPATAPLVFTNIGGTVAYTVIGCTGSPGYTASAFPLTLAAGGSGVVTVGCTTPSAPGTSAPSGTLACTTTQLGFNPIYNVTCSSTAASISNPVPMLGAVGQTLVILLLLAAGLLGLQTHRRSG